AGHEVDALRQDGAEIADHRLLDRPDVADDAAARKMRREGGSNLGIGADRNTDDDEIGSLHAFAGRVVDAVDEAELAGLVARALRAWPSMCPARPCRRMACAKDDPIRPSPRRATRWNKGAAVMAAQPPCIPAAAFSGRAATNVDRASTVARISASVPMVTRR